MDFDKKSGFGSGVFKQELMQEVSVSDEDIGGWTMSRRSKKSLSIQNQPKAEFSQTTKNRFFNNNKTERHSSLPRGSTKHKKTVSFKIKNTKLSVEKKREKSFFKALEGWDGEKIQKASYRKNPKKSLTKNCSLQISKNRTMASRKGTRANNFLLKTRSSRLAKHNQQSLSSSPEPSTQRTHRSYYPQTLQTAKKRPSKRHSKTRKNFKGEIAEIARLSKGEYNYLQNLKRYEKIMDSTFKCDNIFVKRQISAMHRKKVKLKTSKLLAKKIPFQKYSSPVL